ncbi:MAG TPA: hypothetical protein VEC06_10365 [Paucimonas sp.]|nr:hypothetical protein [Paucimonas sp.]
MRRFVPSFVHPAGRLLAPAALAACMALSGCGTPKTKISSIEVIADAAANQHSATALDIVFVYDTNSAALLPKTGPEWFEKKDALVAGLAKAIDVVSLEVPPAMTLAAALPDGYAKAIGVYSYANYIAPKGQPMGNLTPFKKITIRLMPETVVYSGD